jgi:putative DNA methylase
VLINKALIEIPPKFAGRPPVFPGAAGERLSWPGATGLAEDVRRYGKWMRDQAEERIGNLYPTVKIGGVDCTVIAWLWARTVTCPNPACGGTMPLVRSFWLGKKRGKERYIKPVVEGKRVRFEIDGPNGVPREGTVSRTGAECVICGTPVPLAYIRDEGKAGRMGAKLMAIAAEGKRQRYYVAPNEEHEKAADVSRPDDAPEAEIPHNPRYLTAPNYGMRTWADLFTNRQLTALTTCSDLVQIARDRTITDGGTPGYADAVATYLALATSRVADMNNSITTWSSSRDQARNLFARQAIPMSWDFAEVNPFAMAAGDIGISVETADEAIRGLPASPPGTAIQANASGTDYASQLVATDPPYYDNVGYADLADFFYVWLRRSIGKVYPGLLGTMLTPKADELVADPFRHKNAERFFEDGYRDVFHRICKGSSGDFPISVFYAFKQAETDDGGDHASTGWETLLEGMLASGWTVTGTWPIRSERGNRPRGLESNALGSSIVLACRPRPADAKPTDRRGLFAALRAEFPAALRKLEQGKVAPVDLRQAAIGPGMAIFSRYARVNEPSGEPMRVWAALSLINQVLDENLSKLEGNVSADTRWAVEWFKQHGFDPGPYGTAEMLSKGTDTDVDVLRRNGIVTSAGGKVTLVHPADLEAGYDPARDDRPSEWKLCMHLAWTLSNAGPDATAQLIAAARDTVDLDDVERLAYLLYDVAEKKGWAETALLFNALGTSWNDIEDVSRNVTGPAEVQGDLLSMTADEDDE